MNHDAIPRFFQWRSAFRAISVDGAMPGNDSKAPAQTHLRPTGLRPIPVTPGTLPRKSVPVALAWCTLNWLIPGLGYLLAGDRVRALLLFLIINFCFVVGLLMGGYILAPGSWHPRAPEFNLVTILTYLSQSFNGLGWVLLQWLQR